MYNKGFDNNLFPIKEIEFCFKSLFPIFVLLFIKFTLDVKVDEVIFVLVVILFPKFLVIKFDFPFFLELKFVIRFSLFFFLVQYDVFD